MGTDSAVHQLVDELETMQRRRGLQSPDWAGSVGPNIGQALALEQHEDGSRRREALVAGLLGHADSLPGDMQLAFISACAIPKRSLALLGERLQYAGDRMHIPVSPRTVRRRLKLANRRVAQTLADDLARRSAAPSTDWVLTALDATTDLTTSRPVFRSTHTLRVVAPLLTEVTERISFPGAAPDADPEFEAEGDCALVRVDRPFQPTWALTMRLARPFTCGEVVSYSLAVRAPSRRLVHPMSVMLPERECRRFSTKVDFGSPSVASRVWRLDGAPAPAAELDSTSGELLDPHQTRVLTASFNGMVRGRVYGLRWEWADGQPSDEVALKG
ncbi:MAG: hypothetical protein JNL54_04120 [Kineosporiaceae bacterium]|nr:hypothetical protein [Kineosporiaceae bacterium]